MGIAQTPAEPYKGEKRPKITGEEEKALLKEARERMRRGLEVDSADRQRAQKELRFVWNLDNCQWDDQAKKARKKRPMLTENRNPSFVRQATNSIRRSRPQIRVLPVDGQGDTYTAQIIEGLTRNIEANSRADLSYDGATDLAGYCGRGYWRVTTEYQDEGFDQDIVIQPVADPFSIVDDPDCAMPDKSDRKFAFEIEKVPRTEYESKYGKKAFSFKEASDALGDYASDWQDENAIVVANYWRVVEERKRIFRMTDGAIVEDPDSYIEEALKTLAPPVMGMAMPPIPAIDAERELCKRRVEWFCIDGMNAHSKGGWKGRYIPLCYVPCEQMRIDGKWHTKGMTFDSQDLTKANNYLLSAQVENIALTPKQPFVGPKGSFASDRAKWNQVNTEAFPFVEYDVQDEDGKPLPPPQRASGVTAQPEISNVRMGVLDGQRAVVGLMGASLGDNGPEIAGIAIEARKAAGDVAVFHVMDNLVRAVRYCGMVIVDLIPHIYDAKRVVRIINPDGEPMMVAIKQAFVDKKSNETKYIDFSAGKYDVTVSAGPAFETQRQSDNARLIDMADKVPQISQVAPDLLVKELLPGTNGDKIAQRLHRTLDPAITGDAPSQQTQQMQQQMQALQQQMQQLSQERDFLAAELAKQRALLEREAIKNDTARIEQQRKVAELEASLAKANVDLAKKDLELQTTRLEFAKAAMPQPPAGPPAPLQ